MFTGIIETLGIVREVLIEGSNRTFTVESVLSKELKVDQSVAHNGVCLTVTKISGDSYTVTAIEETLQKTNLGDLAKGDLVNLERCMKSDGRFDGHMVYGHVDGIGTCREIIHKDGSTEFVFYFAKENAQLIVEKGSVTINGTSLTVFEVTDDTFKVAIIPYTLEHTNIHCVKVNSTVNLEYDILGKYVARLTHRE